MTVNDGGPAFPRDERYLGHNGMTKREWFAGQAVGALITGRDWSRITNDKIKVEAWAHIAYMVADAMLAEGAKGGGK